MSKLRVVFMGTADFAVSSLSALIHDNHYQVVGVVTQPDRPAGRKMQMQESPVKQLAKKHNIEVLCPESVNTTEAVEVLKRWQAELGVVVAFGQILKKEVIESFSRGCVNVHGSLLPRWRGAAPIQRALMAGDEYSGVSLQQISATLDAGDVIGVRRVRLTDDIDAQNLYDKLKALGADLLIVDLMDYMKGNLAAVTQDESLVTKAKKIKKEEGLIDWSLSSREIFNNYRGLKMWPGVWTTRQGKTLKIGKLECVDEGLHSVPGSILKLEKDHWEVACGKGSLRVFQVQPESKPMMAVSAYQAGNSVQEGEILGEK